MNNIDTSQFGNIAVLAGGDSRERNISLQSGAAVFSALESVGAKAELIDTKDLDINHLKGFDCAFIALHGTGGEDGSIQALLEFLNIPYTGSGIAASAIAMDKVLSKKIWQTAGLPLASSYVTASEEQALMYSESLGFPVMFKPSLEGSSVGISRVDTSDEISAAFKKANLANQQVLIEKFIQGKEYSVAIVGDEILPSVQLATKRSFYDFDAKYLDDDTEYFCPSGLSDEQEKVIQNLALQGFTELNCSGWGRIDFMQNENGDFFLLEANTAPGLTSHSLVPMEAKQVGYSFEDLVVKILQNLNRKDT